MKALLIFILFSSVTVLAADSACLKKLFAESDKYAKDFKANKLSKKQYVKALSWQISTISQLQKQKHVKGMCRYMEYDSAKSSFQQQIRLVQHNEL
jgi:hypothetical protein